jgi:hypothetical protein
MRYLIKRKLQSWWHYIGFSSVFQLIPTARDGIAALLYLQNEGMDGSSPRPCILIKTIRIREAFKLRAADSLWQ